MVKPTYLVSLVVLTGAHHRQLCCDVMSRSVAPSSISTFACYPACDLYKQCYTRKFLTFHFEHLELRCGWLSPACS